MTYSVRPYVPLPCDALRQVFSVRPEGSRVLSSEAAGLLDITVTSAEAGSIYLQLFDATAVPANGAVPVVSLSVPGNSCSRYSFCEGGLPVMYFRTGLTAVVSSTSKTLTQASAGTKQVETATIVGTITLAGTMTLTVSSSWFSSQVLTVSVALNDTASQVAAKCRAALAAHAVISEYFTVGGTGDGVALTAISAEANDATLNIAFTNGTCTGLTPNATSANTTPGAAPTASVLMCARII